MSNENLHLTVALVPPTSPAGVVVSAAAALVRGTHLPSEKAREADVIVVDLRLQEGRAFAADGKNQNLALVGIVEWEDEAQRGALAPLTDFVVGEISTAELVLRVRQAHSRWVTARDSTRQQRDLRLLLGLTADYAASLDVAELLHAVTRKLAQEMDILRASLVVLDDAQTGIIVAASDDPALTNLRIDLEKYPEIREVVRTRKPVILEDAPTHPLLEGVRGQMKSRGIHAIAALPLVIQGEVLGVLLLRAGADRRGFHPREIDFLATVSHATAIALRNARLVESIRERTEREKTARIAAEKRAEQLQRYESYFAHVSDGVALLDASAQVLTLNPAGARILEFSPADARGKHINALTQPTDPELVMSLLHEMGSQRPPRRVDLAVRTQKGSQLTLSVAVSPLTEEGATAILSFRDVTEERRLQEELRSTKDFLERLIDSSVDAIIAADMKGKIILFNKGAEAICGYTSAEVLAGFNVRNIYPPGVARAVMEKLRSPEFGGKGRLNVNREEIVTKNGERVPVNMTAAIIYEGEREVATFGIFTDLRDKMQLERKLSVAQDRLEESERNAVIVALAGTAAHELNQPLTSVMGYAELLKRKLKPDDFATRPVEVIYREAERMAEIVRKIGKITRYETKAYVGSAKIVDLEKATSHED